MKKQFLLTFFACWTLNLQAQVTSLDNTPVNNKLRKNIESGSLYDINDINFSSSEARFFKDSVFRLGELRTRKGLFTTELVYRFDQFEQTIEVKMESGKQMLLNTKDILYCKVFYDHDTAVFMPVVVPATKKLTLVHVVYKTPTLQLYRGLEKRYVLKADPYTLTREVETVNDYRYYIRKNNKDALIEVKINPNSLSEVMPEKRNRIVSLFKGKEDLTVSKVVHIMGELDKYAPIQ